MKLRLSLLLATVALTSAAWAQTETTPPATTTPPAEGGETTNANGNGRGGGGGRRGGGNFNPEEFQTRMLQRIRDEMGVTKDDEWAIISERITVLNEARRSTMGGFGMRGPGGGGGGGRRNGGGSPEVQALQTAIHDNLPDAEVQARLAKVREVRKENEAKVTKAQEDLKAVLSVRQEAVAVMSGLLQ